MHIPRKSLLWSFIVAAVSGTVAGLPTVFVNDRTVSDKPTVLEGLRSPRSLAAISDGSVRVSEVLGGRLLRLTASGGVEVLQEGPPAGPTADILRSSRSCGACLSTYIYRVVYR
jgi:hypothetical protein